MAAPEKDGEALACAAAALAGIAREGRLRAAINLGNATLARRDAASGALAGTSPALARRLGDIAGCPVDFVEYGSAGQVVAAADRDEWDIAFLAVDPARANVLCFSQPYLTIEATYLVREGSPLRHADEIDAEGIDICVTTNAAYDLHLSRTIQRARLLRWPTPSASLAAFIEGTYAAVAGVRPQLERAAAENRGLRVLPGRICTIGQAVAIPIRHAALARHLDTLVAVAAGTPANTPG